MIDTEKTVHTYSETSTAIIAQYDGCIGDGVCGYALQRALIYGHWKTMDEPTRARAAKTIAWLDDKIRDYKYGYDR